MVSKAKERCSEVRRAVSALWMLCVLEGAVFGVWKLEQNRLAVTR